MGPGFTATVGRLLRRTLQRSEILIINFRRANASQLLPPGEVYLCCMAKEMKPIKRSTQLTPLSKDHHEGLLFAWKIRQGLNNGTDVNLIAAYAQWFWKNHLEEHFREEEQILAPHLPADDALLQRMMDEHQEIEAMIHINESIADAALLEKLAQAVDDHIRFEERIFFPHAEKTISDEGLNAIFDALPKKKAEDEKWAQEFWVKK